MMELAKDSKTGVQYYKILDENSLPTDWVNNPAEFKGFPFTTDLKGFKFPSANPVPILAYPDEGGYLFWDNDRFYFWWAIAGTLERIESPTDLKGILTMLKEDRPCKITTLMD